MSLNHTGMIDDRNIPSSKNIEKKSTSRALFLLFPMVARNTAAPAAAAE